MVCRIHAVAGISLRRAVPRTHYDTTTLPERTAQSPELRALLVGAGPRGQRVQELLGGLGWKASVVATPDEALGAVDRSRFDLVVLVADDVENHYADAFQRLIEGASERHIAAILVSDDGRLVSQVHGHGVSCVSGSVSVDELRGRLSMVDHYRSMVIGLESELARLQQLTDLLNGHFQEMDEELQLAGGLQRDFLPDLGEPIGGVRFSAVYRPLSWVSGDIFDVFPIDERHTGVYIADAVGHGVAAGLLTMFIKRLIAPRGDRQGGVAGTSPSEVLRSVNLALCAQRLPSCQFVTACYGVLDHEQATLTVARAGHPYPIRHRSGQSVELRVPGGLLGLDARSEFPEQAFELAIGDRVLFHTDGFEPLPVQQNESAEAGVTSVRRAFEAVGDLPLPDAIERLADSLEAGWQPEASPDDVTILAFEWPGKR